MYRIKWQTHCYMVAQELNIYSTRPYSELSYQNKTQQIWSISPQDQPLDSFAHELNHSIELIAQAALYAHLCGMRRAHSTPDRRLLDLRHHFCRATHSGVTGTSLQWRASQFQEIHYTVFISGQSSQNLGPLRTAALSTGLFSCSRSGSLDRGPSPSS